MMPSPRMDQVFYSAHSKASHYILRHTSHRFRAIIEHVVLGLAICAFCTVILSHRAFVHREDIACISHHHHQDNSGVEDVEVCGNNMSLYSILVQVVRGGYMWAVQQGPTNNKSASSLSSKNNKHVVPLMCLKSIPGFRMDADVNHILYQNNKGDGEQSISDGGGDGSSRAFTIYRGHDNNRLVTGFSFDQSKPQETCVIDTSETTSQEQQRQRTLSERLWVSVGGQQMQQQQQYNPCSEQMMTFLSQHGYLPTDERNNQQPPPTAATSLSPIIYSYSHSHGLLSLTPNLQHAHNVSTQFIIPSTTDENCFGEPFLKSIIFRLVGDGADTVILNWILGLQHYNHMDVVDGNGNGRPIRFVYHWKGKKLIDLNIFDKDHYAFSSRSSSSSGDEEEAAARDSNKSYFWWWSSSKSIHAIVSKLQTHPIHRFLRFLTFRLSVLLSSLFIFFLTTSLVSFTLQETQDRMLEFTLQLKDRVRNRLPLAGLIVRHVLENLVFVPIMVGMIFFLIEYYGGDKFLAFSVLSMVWLCEVFSAISIRTVEGIHFFPRVFFLYFTLFHVYFFSCPVGFTYASLASTVLFLFHTILFFWNRYELPALHAGLITSQSPRANIDPIDDRGVWIDNNNNNNNNNIGGGTETTASSSTFIPQPQPYPVIELGSPMRSAVAAASTSLQSIRSLASIHSLSSLAERTPNLLFHGGYNLNDSNDTDGEDSYIERVGRSPHSDFNSFHHDNS